MRSAEFDRRAAREHVRALAAEHGVTIEWVSSWGNAEAWVEAKVAAVPRIRTGRDYLVALHELGHCLQPEAVTLNERYDLPGQLGCEGWAWAWAAANADPDLADQLSARDWRLVASSFGGYIRSAARRELPDLPYLQFEAGTAPAA